MTLRTLAPSRPYVFALFLSAAAATFCSLARGSDPTADILLRVLVEKGVLTHAEAQEVRQEVAAAMAEEAAGGEANGAVASAGGPRAAANAGPRPSSPSAGPPPQQQPRYAPMPDLLGGLKLYGDLRLRYQYENAESPDGENNDRSRWRYRARFGADFDYADSGFSMGARLETSSSNDSTNANFGGFFDKTGDELRLGLLYARYRDESWDLRVGKHHEPFFLPSALWDSDLNPEGLSQTYRRGNWAFHGGQYVVDEERESRETPGGPRVDDDFLFVGQAEWGGARGLRIAPIAMGTTDGVSTASESAAFAGENAVRHFDDFLFLGLPVEYRFDAAGSRHKAFATYGVNLQGDDLIGDPNSPFHPAAGSTGSASRNQLFLAGYQVGLASWLFGLEYRYLEAASFTPNLSDSDFAKNHLNQSGFVIQSRYAFTDFLSGTLSYKFSDRIDDDFVSPVADVSETRILQLDLSSKF